MPALIRPLIPILFGLTLSSPCLADDIILNGLHCNSLCQSWMGVKRATAPTPAPAPAPVIRRSVPAVAETSPVVEEVRRQPVDASPTVVRPARERSPLTASLDPPKRARPDRQPEAAPAGVESASTAAPAQIEAVSPPRPDIIPVAPPVEDAAREEVEPRLPRAEEGAELPRLDTLVAVRGAVMVESADERARNQKQRAALLKETTRSE